MILEILKQKFHPDLEVFRKYKSDDKNISANRYLLTVPILFDDRIYEPCYADITKVNTEVNIMLLNVLQF